MSRTILPAVALFFHASSGAEPLIVDHGRLFVPMTVNGQQTEALLDSGAEMTVIDPVLARRAGILAGAQVEMKGTGATSAKANFAHDVRIAAIGVDLGPKDVVVLDLSEVASRLIKRPTIAILGRDIFDSARLRIDLQQKDVRTLGKYEVPKGIALPLTGHKGIESIPVTVEGTAVAAELDFGNGSLPIVSRGIVNKLGLKVTGKNSAGGIGGAVDRETVVLPTLIVAGATFRDVTATVDEKDEGLMMNIGTTILRHFVVTTDFTGRAAYFEPVAGIR
ncbi:hypothetical protein G7076_03260 [Sphingomonas sp. HDW15A]|uniref:aspartyl protease family protein n=1 Tax=Sphingomonas sp. HDW15A TaxID=2714942 RepID=UPI00140BA8B8|nr:pepsin/retropepsin-like aspartic protease family protein [Sphingomonas sp. HDW15A]QIK95625.1 hypothetical protein G7076_03260 [Sphingomonas sp. HDW15A]